MVRRFLSLLVLVWLLGFAWFAIFLPRPAGDEHTDAAVVFTGGKGRVDRGLEVLERKLARRLLVSGVDRQVKPAEFEAEFRIPHRLMQCCITLGFESFDTRANATETSRWLADHKVRSVRLITSDWHMRRAALELKRIRPQDVTVLLDGVPTEPSFRNLFLEYHKLLARWLFQLWDTWS